MLKFKEINIIQNCVCNVPGSNIPVRIYISLCEKYRNNIKFDNNCIIFTQDCAYPEQDYITKLRFPVMIGGNILELKNRLETLPLFFNPLSYDSGDFRGSYLAKLVPISLAKDKHKEPKNYLNWQYEPEVFNYIKPNKSLESKKITYAIPDKIYSFPTKSGTPVHVKVIKSSYLEAPKPFSETVLPTKLKLVEKPKLADPSNMNIISYE